LIVSVRTIARLSLIVLVAGCDPAAGEPHGRESPKPEPSAPAAFGEVEEVEPVEPPIEPSIEQPEPAIAFDPTTATTARVRIVAVHRDRSWTACGVIHSTGAIEVEVLEVGEPAPRMILIISCPTDFGHRELLEVGTVLQVKLFTRRQRWPRPAIDRKLPPELPRRYVDTMSRVDADSVKATLAAEPAARE